MASGRVLDVFLIGGDAMGCICSKCKSNNVIPIMYTDEGVGFILCEIKVFRIRNSEPAPKFEIIEQPNNWVKEMKKPSGSIERTVLPKIKDILEWRVVKAGDILIAKGTDEEATLLENGHVSINDEEMSMQDWLKRITGWKSVETYKFAIHKESGKSLSQIRKEYMDEQE